MQYSVCIDAVFMGKGTFAEAMRAVRGAGYDAVEFWTWWDKDMDLFRHVQRDLDLRVTTFCTKFINPGDPELQQDYLEGLRESIAVAETLDCDTILVQAGWEFDSFRKEITRERHRRTLIDTMRKAALLAAQSGITLVLEPLNQLVDHPGYHLSTSADAFALIDQIGSPNVKILFDLYHQQITEGNLIRNITNNIEKIGHFHAAGNPGRNEITKGEIDYRHVFAAISSLGYEKCIGLEYLTDEDPAPGLVEARKLFV